MPLSTVTLKWAITDLIQSGLSATLSITPTFQMSDPTDHKLIPPVARTYRFTGGTGQLAGIVSNDNANILPAYDPPDSPGTGYLISVTSAEGQVIVPQFQTQLLSANAVDGVLWLDALVVVPVVATSYQYQPLASGEPIAGYVLAVVQTGSAATQYVPQSTGSGTVTSVNDVDPDDSGNVELSAADVGALAPNGDGSGLTGITAAQVGADASGAAATAQTNAQTYAAGVAGTAQSNAETYAAAQASAAQAAAEAASLSLANGGTVAGATAFTSTLTAETPTQAGQVATKAYVDSVAAGLDPKPSVAAVATANITLSGTQTVDGVALTAGQRALATGQSTASQNGLWIVAAGSWSRPADFASGSSQLGAFAFVEAGTNGAGSGWTMVGASAVTVDTSSQTWTQFSGAGEILAGTGLSKSGNTLSVAASGVGAGSFTNASVTVGADGRLTSASSGAAPVTGVTAADASVVIGGTGTAPTVRTGTLDVIATQHPPVASVPMNSQKLTGLANGSASGDSAAFGQTLAGGNSAPLTTKGDLLIASAANTAARLAVGSTGQLLGVSAGLPAYVSLDSSAADIQPVGTQAAGSLGKPADAGHVHPGDFGFSAADYGLLGWTYDPIWMNDASAFSNGVLYLVRLNLRGATTISKVAYWLNSSASGMTANENYVGVYNPSGTLLRASSAGVAETFNDSTVNLCPLSSPVAAGSVPFIWAAYLFNASSPADFLLFEGIGGGSGLWNGPLGAAAARFGTYGSGLTTLPSSITPGSISIFGMNGMWGGIA